MFNVLVLLPATLVLSWLVGRTRNTTVGILLHTLFHGVGAVALMLAILR